MKIVKLFLFTLSLFSSSLALADDGYSKIVAFGDSLSDNGNLYRIMDNMTPFIPNDGLPGMPYFYGRFSNGPTAVEILAEKLQLPLQDYAVGGAKTGLDGSDPLLAGTGLLAQINKATHQNSALDHQALFLVWAGPNDFLANNGAGLAVPNITIPTAVANISKAITELYDHGARTFLVPLMPDLGLTPELSGGPYAGTATYETNLFNGSLEAELRVLTATLKHVTIVRFDTAGLLRAVVANPSGYGFSNVSNSCVPDPTCMLDSFRPDRRAANYLFWDGIHPTANAHRLIADQFLALVAPFGTGPEEAHEKFKLDIPGYKGER